MNYKPKCRLFTDLGNDGGQSFEVASLVNKPENLSKNRSMQMVGIILMCISTLCAVITNTIASHLMNTGSDPGILNFVFFRMIPMCLSSLVLSRYMGAQLISDLKGVKPSLMVTRVVAPILGFIC